MQEESILLARTQWRESRNKKMDKRKKRRGSNMRLLEMGIDPKATEKRE